VIFGLIATLHRDRSSGRAFGRWLPERGQQQVGQRLHERRRIARGEGRRRLQIGREVQGELVCLGVE